MKLLKILLAAAIFSGVLVTLATAKPNTPRKRARNAWTAT